MSGDVGRGCVQSNDNCWFFVCCINTYFRIPKLVLACSEFNQSVVACSLLSLEKIEAFPISNWGSIVPNCIDDKDGILVKIRLTVLRAGSSHMAVSLGGGGGGEEAQIVLNLLWIQLFLWSLQPYYIDDEDGILVKIMLGPPTWPCLGGAGEEGRRPWAPWGGHWCFCFACQ